MPKVLIKKYNGIHNLTHCNQCNWQIDPFSDDHLTPKQVAAGCVKHVRQTGHTVIREVANSITYSPIPNA